MAYQLSYVDNDGGDYTVKFYAMYIQLPVSDSAPSTVVKEYRDDFDDYIAENKDDCPGTLCDYMHNSCYRWWLLALEENFVISAFTGIAIGIYRVTDLDSKLDHFHFCNVGYYRCYFL